MKKITVIGILLLVMLLSVVQANSIQSIDMKIYIDTNGNAKVTEVWDCKADSGTEGYHPYYNLGSSQIRNLTVTDENGRQYETLSSWDVDRSFAEKKYTCGIHSVSNGVELCWGISEYGRKTYTVQYEISNFVSQLNDAQMIYWTLIPYEFSTAIGNVEIEIKSDNAFTDTLDVWGYGNYGGLCYVSDGTVKMSSDGRLDTSEYMTILIKFPTNQFQCSSKIAQDFSYYLNMAEEGATQYLGDDDLSDGEALAIFFGTFGAVSSFIIYELCKENKNARLDGIELSKENENQIKNAEYYRDIPCQKGVLKAFYIAYRFGLMKNKSDVMGALLLKWLKEKRISIEKRNVIRGTAKQDKEETCVVFLASTYEDMDMQEKDLYEMMYEASEDGVLEKKELKKWSSNKYSTLLNWFDTTLKKERSKLVEAKELQEYTKGKIIKTQKYIPSENVILEAKHLSGLKKYLKDYTLIHEREPMEISMFEDYLIFAQIFGIADKVMKDFKELYPELIEQSSYYSYHNIYFLTSYARTSYSSANSARAAAEGYSSGGGGFSSGGGGGGSFGGGGGRRWIPLKLIQK